MLSNVNGWDKRLFVLSMRVIGMILIIYSIPNLLDAFVVSALSGRFIGSSLDADLIRSIIKSAWVAKWSSIVRALVSMAMGGYLVSGASHLVNILYKDENAATIASE